MTAGITIHRRRDARPIRLALAFAALLAGASAWGPVRAHAAEPVFGEPTARSTFLETLDFTQPVTLDQQPAAVEVLWSTPFSEVENVEPIEPPAAGSQVLTWQKVAVDLVTGFGMTANTDVTVRWRVTMPDGSVSVSPPVTVLYEDTRFAWKTRDQGMVRLYYTAATEQYADRAARMADAGITRATEFLGVTEDERVDFFLYESQDAMLTGMGRVLGEGTAGSAVSEIRTLFGCLDFACGGVDYAFDLVIPHELVHLVFNTATDNPFNEPPLWLNEGLASYLSEGADGDGNRLRQAVEAAVTEGSVIPLTAIALNFPRSDDSKNRLSYAEGASAIDFAIRTYGEDAFVRMVRSYAEGRTNAQAFVDAFGVDDKAFEAAWLTGIGAREPEQFGPLPAPPNPDFPPGGAVPNPTGAPATPGASVPAASAAPGETAGATARPVASAAPSEPEIPAGTAGSDSPVVIILAILVAVLLAVVLLAMVLRSRRRPAPPAVGTGAGGNINAPDGTWTPPDWARGTRGGIPPVPPATPGGWQQAPAGQAPEAWQQPGPGQPGGTLAQPGDWQQTPAGWQQTPAGWQQTPAGWQQTPAGWQQQPPAAWQQQPPVAWQQQPPVAWQQQPPAAWRPGQAPPPWAQQSGPTGGPSGDLTGGPTTSGPPTAPWARPVWAAPAGAPGSGPASAGSPADADPTHGNPDPAGDAPSTP